MVEPGQKYGMLTVVSFVGRDKNNRHRWECVCDCGKQVTPSQNNLRHMSSCGCMRKWSQFVHGQKGTPEHRSWAAMIQRCTNPNVERYNIYGARGIRVCDRWRDFINFLSDMGPRPEGTSLDRYPDQNGNYEPNNCRWATAKEQAQNKTNNVKVILSGDEMVLIEALKIINVEPSAFSNYVRRSSKTHQEAIEYYLTRKPRKPIARKAA